MPRTLRDRTAAGPLLLAGVLLTAGCSLFEGGNTNGGAVEPPPASVDAGKVVIKQTAFQPAEVQIPVGQELVWSFEDNGLTHTVTADDGSFDSGRLTSGEFRRAFATQGEITYHCEVHARMKGTVVVS